MTLTKRFLTRISRRAGGFTLIELGVASMLLGIAVTIAVPLAKDAVDMRVIKSQGGNANTFLVRARSLAITSQRCVSVELSGTDTLELRQKADGNCVTTTTYKQSEYALVDKATFVNVDLVIETSDGTSVIIFRPNGQLRGDGDLDMFDDAARIQVAPTKSVTQAAPLQASQVSGAGGVASKSFGEASKAKAPPFSAKSINLELM